MSVCLLLKSTITAHRLGLSRESGCKWLIRALYNSQPYLFPEPHKYQLRAYIYQARDLLASDADGFSGKIAKLTMLLGGLSKCVF